MLVNYGMAVAESQFTTTPDKRGVIGQIAFTDTGRQFRYCKSADTESQGYWTGMKNDATNKNSGLAADVKVGDTVIQLKPGHQADGWQDGTILINNKQLLEFVQVSGDYVYLRDQILEDCAANTGCQVRPNDYDNLKKVTSGAKVYTRSAVPAGHYFWCEV